MLVAVSKKSGSVSNCVDLKPLKKVLQETHPIPKADKTLAQLRRSNYFLVNSMLIQYFADSPGRKVLLFSNLHFSLWEMMLSQLPFGISSALEVFQKRINQSLEGLPRAQCQTYCCS